MRQWCYRRVALVFVAFSGSHATATFCSCPVAITTFSQDHRAQQHYATTLTHTYAHISHRAYAQPQIEALRMRTVQLKIGARPLAAGESTATVTMTRHLFPFGAAITGPELDNKAYQDFFLQNFNGVTDEVFSKWHVSDSLLTCSTTCTSITCALQHVVV
jgi:hypothetical protein